MIYRSPNTTLVPLVPARPASNTHVAAVLLPLAAITGGASGHGGNSINVTFCVRRDLRHDLLSLAALQLLLLSQKLNFFAFCLFLYFHYYYLLIHFAEKLTLDDSKHIPRTAPLTSSCLV